MRLNINLNKYSIAFLLIRIFILIIVLLINVNTLVRCIASTSIYLSPPGAHLINEAIKEALERTGSDSARKDEDNPESLAETLASRTGKNINLCNAFVQKYLSIFGKHFIKLLNDYLDDKVDLTNTNLEIELSNLSATPSKLASPEHLNKMIELLQKKSNFQDLLTYARKRLNILLGSQKSFEQWSNQVKRLHDNQERSADLFIKELFLSILVVMYKDLPEEIMNDKTFKRIVMKILLNARIDTLQERMSNALFVGRSTLDNAHNSGFIFDMAHELGHNAAEGADTGESIQFGEAGDTNEAFAEIFGITFFQKAGYVNLIWKALHARGYPMRIFSLPLKGKGTYGSYKGVRQLARILPKDFQTIDSVAMLKKTVEILHSNNKIDSKSLAEQLKKHISKPVYDARPIIVDKAVSELNKCQ